MIRYILLITLLAINLYSYRVPVPGVLFLPVSVVILACLYRISKRENVYPPAIMLELMCYVLPISYMNIFGGRFATLPIPWYYVLGVPYVVLLAMRRGVSVRSEGRLLMLALGFLLLLGLLPTIYSPRPSEGITTYITMAFFIVIVAFSVRYSRSFSTTDVSHIRNALLMTSFVSAVAILMQFGLFHFAGISVGRLGFSGGSRVAFALMSEDLSSTSIFLAIGVFIALQSLRKHYLQFIIIILATAATSTRTGVAALMITFVFYALYQRGFTVKVGLLALSALIVRVLESVYQVVRPDAAGSFLYDNGRFDGYSAAFNIWLKSPMMGVGFSDSWLEEKMGGSIPHFTLLNTLTQAGAVYTGLLALILFYTLSVAFRDRTKPECWIMLLSLIGSCFIPSLFSARFITIVVSLVFIANQARELNPTGISMQGKRG